MYNFETIAMLPWKKTTQNELINICSQEILSIIISRVKAAKFYSIIFDETQDISRISQMTLVIRYLYQNEIREDFVQFIDLIDEISAMNETKDNSLEIRVTGINLGKVVLKSLEKLDLDLNYCVGITTDGCSVMTSDIKGAVSSLRKEAKNAVYSPCHSHILNLSISQSSSVQSVRNAVGIMKETISFFRVSAKRSNALKKVMGSELSTLCETRWVERHIGVIQFRTLLPKIIQTLDTVASWTDIQTASKARTLQIALCDTSFLVAVICLSDLIVAQSIFFKKLTSILRLHKICFKVQ